MNYANYDSVQALAREYGYKTLFFIQNNFFTAKCELTNDYHIVYFTPQLLLDETQEYEVYKNKEDLIYRCTQLLRLQ